MGTIGQPVEEKAIAEGRMAWRGLGGGRGRETWEDLSGT